MRGCSGGDEDNPKQNKKPDKPLRDSVGGWEEGTRATAAHRGKDWWLCPCAHQPGLSCQRPHHSLSFLTSTSHPPGARTVPTTATLSGLPRSCCSWQTGVMTREQKCEEANVCEDLLLGARQQRHGLCWDKAGAASKAKGSSTSWSRGAHWNGLTPMPSPFLWPKASP